MPPWQLAFLQLFQALGSELGATEIRHAHPRGGFSRARHLAVFLCILSFSSFSSSWFWFSLYTVPCSADLTLFVLPACCLFPLAWLPNLEQLRAPHQGQLEFSREGEFLVNLVNDRRYRSLAIKTAQCFSCWTYDVIDHTVINNTDSAARLVAFGQCHLGGCVPLSNASTFFCLRMTK